MKLRKVLLTFTIGIAIQAGVYYYLDRVLLVPASDFQIGSTNQQEALGFGAEPNGQAFYSYDKRFMATVVEDQVSIYEAGKKDEPHRISLKGKSVSFFEWLPDRDLAIFATYGKDSKTGRYSVHIAQYNPLMPDHELDTPIDDAPAGSRITDAAYSTATNVVYMKLRSATTAIVFIVPMLTTIRAASAYRLKILARSPCSTTRIYSSTITLEPVLYTCSTVKTAAGEPFLRAAISD